MKKQLMLVLAVLLVGLISTAAFAQPPENHVLIEDFEDATPETLEQYWRPDFSYLEVNEDPEFAKSGTKSLKMVKDLSHFRQANVLLNSNHPMWGELLNHFKLGFWVYIADHENIYENEWALFLATHSGGEWKEAILNMRQSDLQPGWNWIETYILLDESIDELMFGFNYHGEEEVPTYIDYICVY